MTGARDEPTPAGLPRSAWRDPAVLLVTGLGCGFLRPAPGTWGSLAALALWWWLLAGLSWPVQLAVAAVVFALGMWLVGRVAARYRVDDDPAMVIDEVVGLWIALLAAPKTVLAAAAGFVLFRLFDVLKPPPVGWADRRLPGALGVMVDDVLAGGLAMVVLQLAFHAVASPGNAVTT